VKRWHLRNGLMEYLTMEEAEGKFGKKGVANA
jgi:hypothetical protein